MGDGGLLGEAADEELASAAAVEVSVVVRGLVVVGEVVVVVVAVLVVVVLVVVVLAAEDTGTEEVEETKVSVTTAVDEEEADEAVDGRRELVELGRGDGREVVRGVDVGRDGGEVEEAFSDALTFANSESFKGNSVKVV